MPLRVNLRHLEARDLRLEGEMPAAELDLEIRDEMIRAERPLKYDLRVEELHHALLVQGEMEMILDCECVRCLKPFQQRLVLKDWTVHVPLQGDDKAPVDNDCVDLTPFVREDILLELPRHPVCEPGCAGLKKFSPKTRGKQENKSAWAELNKLKL
ncbi:MAG: DUF177 domain-containing protein [Verrucomicrobia bacterium]|nr:DUF177 domain-containing protein [Verrucomicrobiota bacterium]MDE3099118.1 DUF177 domain-containing protein [Verrucomicrobiota bacterium]